MLSRLITNSYKILIEIVLWITLFTAIIGGGGIGAGAGSLFGGAGSFGGGDNVSGAVIGGLFGAVVWLVVASIFFGVFLVLLDIRNHVKSIDTLQHNKKQLP